jgi:F-type H+-transporting ATPase subunit epsilon
MSTTMTLDILTPERSVCCVEAEIVIARALDGELGILPNHAPLVVALDIAPLRYRKDGMEHFVAISNGFMEVKDNRVIILAPTAETEAEIDFSRAESAKERAERRIAEHAPDTDVRRAELALRRALMRLKIAELVRR